MSASVNLGIWGKLTGLVLFLLALAVIIAVAIWYAPVIRQNQRMREEILRLEARIKNEELLNKKLESTIESLRRDSNTVERLARERLGYAKPGETVIFFEPAPAIEGSK
jgi:cell division protein FtsB